MRRLKVFFAVFVICILLVSLTNPGAVDAATSKTVKVTKNYNPGYYWCQHLDGHWSTSSSMDGTVTASNDGGEPKKTKVTTQVNIAVPTDLKWIDADNNSYSYSEVKNPVPVSVIMHASADPALQGNPRIENNQVIISGYSGKGVYGYSDSICGGSPGIIYPFPVTVTFEGTVTIADEFLGLEIEPTEKTLTVGQTQRFIVYANWRQDGNVRRYEVSNSKLSWSSNAPTKASVDSGGIVKGLQATPGTSYVTITAYFAEQKASVTAKVWVVDAGSITANLQATVDPNVITEGTTGTVKVSLDASGSFTTGKTIDSYRFWISKTPFNVADEGNEGSTGTNTGSTPLYSQSFTGTSPNTTFYAKVKAYDSNLGKYAYAYAQVQVKSTPANACVITGDFDVIPGSINYRETFSFKPKNISVSGGSYSYHEYKIEINGQSWTSPKIYGKDTTSTYNYNNYPWIITIGRHEVSMRVTASCGQSEWIH